MSSVTRGSHQAAIAAGLAASVADATVVMDGDLQDPPELLPELFERFTRGEAGRARDAGAAGKSTGLGLAIVDAVVAAHGGAIVVTSRPGMTRFAILLPLLHQPAGQPQASPV